MRCKKCKKRINKKFSFCPYCGLDVNEEYDRKKHPLKVQDIFAGFSYGFGTGSSWISALILVFCVSRTFNVITASGLASHGDIELLCSSIEPLFLANELIGLVGLPLLMHFVSMILGIIFGLIGKTSTRYYKKARKGITRSITGLATSIFGMLIPLYIIVFLTLVLAITKTLFMGL